jgi:DNA-binding MarR family transcriptional regulator
MARLRIDSTAKAASAAAVKTGTEPARRRGRSRARADGERWQAELLELGTAFRDVFRSLRRLRGRDTHLIGSEVSHAQMELLLELSERGPLSAGELALAAGLTPATVTQMLEHLAASGQVRRNRSEADRRVVVSELTEQGQQKVIAKRAAWQRRWEQALGDVDAEELRTATRVLQRLHAIFEDAPGTGG